MKENIIVKNVLPLEKYLGKKGIINLKKLV